MLDKSKRACYSLRHNQIRNSYPERRRDRPYEASATQRQCATMQTAAVRVPNPADKFWKMRESDHGFPAHPRFLGDVCFYRTSRSPDRAQPSHRLEERVFYCERATNHDRKRRGDTEITDVDAASAVSCCGLLVHRQILRRDGRKSKTHHPTD